MDPAALAGRLEGVEGRLVGTDAERRAALLCAQELRGGGRRPRVETLWVRPRRGWAFALYAALGVAASVVAVSAPEVGLGLAAGALAAALLELAGLPVASLLQTRRATQNVLAAARGEQPVLLVLAASVAARRDSLLARLPRVPATALLLAALAGVALCAAARVTGAEGAGIGAAQLAPSTLLILLLGAFLDAELAAPPQRPPGAGPAAAVAIARALDAQAPRALRIEVLLHGGEPGLRAYAAARRRKLRAEDVVVVLLEPGEGPTGFATRHPQLRRLAEALPGAEPDPGPPRLGRWPVIRLRGGSRGLAAAGLRLVAAIDREILKADGAGRR